jgi:hypothetical protein
LAGTHNAIEKTVHFAPGVLKCDDWLYILYYYYINILIPTTFNSWIILSTKQLYSQYDDLLSTIPFFPFLKKKQNPNTNIQKNTTISPISKTLTLKRHKESET